MIYVCAIYGLYVILYTEYVSNVKTYIGTAQQVLDSSRRSAKEHAVEKIVAHYGDPLKRTTLGFTLLFKDNTKSELRYDQVRDNAALDEYIMLNKDLLPLLYQTARDWISNWCLRYTYIYLGMCTVHYLGHKVWHL